MSERDIESLKKIEEAARLLIAMDRLDREYDYVDALDHLARLLDGRGTTRPRVDYLLAHPEEWQ